MKQAFVKYTILMALAGCVIFSSSFKQETRESHFEKHFKKNVPFKGNYTYNIGTNTGNGTASHLGKFDIVEPNNIVQPNQNGSLTITGTAIITAANGDQIFATHSGVAQPLGNGMAQVVSEFTITGGSGKFEDATGSFEIAGPVNLATGIGSFTFYGMISY